MLIAMGASPYFNLHITNYICASFHAFVKILTCTNMFKTPVYKINCHLRIQLW